MRLCISSFIILSILASVVSSQTEDSDLTDQKLSMTLQDWITKNETVVPESPQKKVNITFTDDHNVLIGVNLKVKKRNGIIIGVVALVMIILTIGICCWIRRIRKNRREAALNEKDEQIEKLRDELHELVDRSISRGPDECDSMKKTLDVFISYRRSNGSQLASLLKVYLESRQFSVFLDIDRLEAGKFDNNLLQSIKEARNFVLVLTSGALDRCKDDVEQKDWIHKEVVCALNSCCNIVPVLDNFKMPNTADLPVSMRALTSYNGVNWVHEYQGACVDKLERFLKTEENDSEEIINEKKNICVENIERSEPEGQVTDENNTALA